MVFYKHICQEIKIIITKKSLSKLERLFLFKMISNFQFTKVSKANVTLLLLQGLYN